MADAVKKLSLIVFICLTKYNKYSSLVEDLERGNEQLLVGRWREVIQNI